VEWRPDSWQLLLKTDIDNINNSDVLQEEYTERTGTSNDVIDSTILSCQVGNCSVRACFEFADLEMKFLLEIKLETQILC
jgi:hypothetical protein